MSKTALINGYPTFRIRDVPVHGNLILAPMAGFSDVPHRALCREYGSALNYTEFVAAEELLSRSQRALDLLRFTADDRPMVVQIFGNDAVKLLRAAQIAENLGPDIIDVNMGCSTRRVSGRGAGVGMMLRPALVAETFALLTKHLSVPVTGKIRLGWENHQTYLEIARIMQDNGASLIAIHPRTKEQKYAGHADWDAIGRLGQVVTIPIIGNGDVCTPADAEEMLDYTGCQAVMVGRGAIGNPWLFARIEKGEISFSTLLLTVKKHLAAMLAYYGDPHGLILFRKYLKRYFEGLPAVWACYRMLVQTDDPHSFNHLLDLADKNLGKFTIAELKHGEYDSETQVQRSSLV